MSAARPDSADPTGIGYADEWKNGIGLVNLRPPRPTRRPDEALRYADTDLSKVAVFRVTIDRKALDVPDFSDRIDPALFPNGVVTVQPGVQSDVFHEAIRRLEHVF